MNDLGWIFQFHSTGKKVLSKRCLVFDVVIWKMFQIAGISLELNQGVVSTSTERSEKSLVREVPIILCGAGAACSLHWLGKELLIDHREWFVPCHDLVRDWFKYDIVEVSVTITSHFSWISCPAFYRRNCIRSEKRQNSPLFILVLYLVLKMIGSRERGCWGWYMAKSGGVRGW